MHIVLGSQSPRRKEILSFFGIPFSVCSSDFDESTILFNGNPQHFVEQQAHYKALSLHKRFPNDLIITADTTVHFQGHLFQKPADRKEAFQFLEQLCGNTHEVYTAVCICHQGSSKMSTEMTKVSFYPLSPQQIDRYIDKVDPFDKAGAYAIQGIGSLIVSKIEGCYYNVMGLPIYSLRHLLKQAGIDLWT